MFKKLPPKSQTGNISESEMSIQQMQAESAGWEVERQVLLENSAASAWRISYILAAALVLALIALAVLAPFYKVIPLTFTVDRNSGLIQMVDPSGVSKIDSLEAVDKHFAVEYVLHRERYEYTLLQMDHDYTVGMSSDSVASRYKALYDGPNSREKRLGADTSQRLTIKSVTLPPGAPGRAVVRFERITRQNGQDLAPESFVATLSYEYIPPKTFKREKEIVSNPFGFTVTGYSVDAEVTSGPQS